jgi:predicted amidophosphoribosyltransferase
VGAAALDLAFPPTCAGCDREGASLCPACLPALGARLRLPPGTPLGLPGEIPEPLVQVEWCAPFSGVARRALHRLKYAGDRRLAEPLGQAVGHRWARAGAGGELLVPVPGSPNRVRDRGYDQATLIARAAGAACGLPVGQLLERTRLTAAQFDLDRAARRLNVVDAFRLRGTAVETRLGTAVETRLGTPPSHGGAPARPGSVDTQLEGLWVVLVDDVLTTGSTLAACARVLLDHGALAVSAVTVARER